MCVDDEIIESTPSYVFSYLFINSGLERAFFFLLIL